MNELARRIAFASGIFVSVAAGAIGCGGGSSGGGPVGPGVPVITSVNGAAEPTTPTQVLMEVNGSGFTGGSATVRFAQSGATLTAVPDAANLADDSLAVVVPGGLTPGAVTVTVSTNGGVSNPQTITIVAAPTNFTPSNVNWGTTVALPGGRRGHRAVAVRKDATTAYVYSIGGNAGAATHLTEVTGATLNATGDVQGAWGTAGNLPAGRAYHAAAVADRSNSPISGTTTAYIYVIGGQEGTTPTGTASVLVASVNRDTGALGSFGGTSSLPQALTGCRAVVANGFLIVTGGYRPDGTASNDVHSARIRADGTLDGFGTAPDKLPAGRAFHQSFAFGGFLYVLMGEAGPLTTPASSTGSNLTSTVFFSRIRRGVPGAWTQMQNSGIKSRAKHEVLQIFGQVIVQGGLTSGGGSFDGEATTIQTDGTFSSWNGLTGNTGFTGVFNAAGLVNPINAANGNPRLLMLGGDTTGGAVTTTQAVQRSTAP